MTEELNKEQTEQNPILDESGGFTEMDMQERMRWLRKKTLEHLWGPTGSVILHVIVITLVLRYFTIGSRNPDLQVEVQMMEMKETNLDEIKKELDQLKDKEEDFQKEEVDVVMDSPPDDKPVDNRDQMEDFAALDIRTDVQSPLVMRGLFAGRSASGRAAMLSKYAGRFSKVTEAAVMRALDWLMEHQLEDGSWQGTSTAQSKTAMTGLALLTFLAHGETHASERYGKTVEKAIRFLVEQDSRGDGTFQNVDGAYYGHGIATYALSEAFALTRIPSIKPAMERSVDRIVKGQQRTGAFNYRLNPGDLRRDTSVAGWMTQALKAAFIAGADVPGLKEAMDLAVAGFKVNYDKSNKLFAYAPGAEQDKQGAGETTGRPSTTPIAVLALQLLGHGKDEEAEAGLSTLGAWTVSWNDNHPSGWPLYTWYYATQAIFHGGGDVWDKWNSMFARMLVENQNADGSWSPTGKTESAYGPVYGTCFSALSLMVYYRFLPTYQPIEVEAKPKETRTDDVNIDVF